MHKKRYQQGSKEKLLRDLQRELGESPSVNGMRRVCQKYFSSGFRRALVGKVPEFFLMYYLGFRLPIHQVRWIHLYVDTQYLLELAPRDHGKSWIFSYGMPLYDIYSSYVRTNLTSVDARILQMSKTDDQAYKFAQQVRETIELNRYLRDDFGDIRDLNLWLKGHFRCKRSATEALEKDYTYEKVGVLGAITGGHFHRVIGDDILDDENTKTQERIQSVDNWFWGTIWNLREPHTKYSMVGTRKSRRDIYNTLLNNPVWRSNVEKAIIKYPMIPDPEKPGQLTQGWLYITNTGRHVKNQAEIKADETIVNVELLTDDYEVLWPPTMAVDNDGNPFKNPVTDKHILFGWGIEELLLDRASQGSTYFDREKQNNISAEEGSVFNRSWFTFFDTGQLTYNTEDSHYYLDGVTSP